MSARRGRQARITATCERSQVQRREGFGGAPGGLQGQEEAWRLTWHQLRTDREHTHQASDRSPLCSARHAEPREAGSGMPTE